MNAQLSLLEPDEPDRISTGELVASTPPGPERLLRELVKRGLQQDALPEAARLLLAWHAFAPVDPDFRICACGCRRSLKGSAGHSQILRWCLSRQGPQGQKSVYPNPDPKSADVTVPRLPTTLRETA